MLQACALRRNIHPCYGRNLFPRLMCADACTAHQATCACSHTRCMRLSPHDIGCPLVSVASIDPRLWSAQHVEPGRADGDGRLLAGAIHGGRHRPRRRRGVPAHAAQLSRGQRGGVPGSSQILDPSLGSAKQISAARCRQRDQRAQAGKAGRHAEGLVDMSHGQCAPDHAAQLSCWQRRDLGSACAGGHD